VVGIVDAAGGLAGIVTDGDLRRHMGADLLQRGVDEVMTADPRTIRPGALAVEALALMNGQRPHISVLFVRDDDDRRPRGLIRVHDCLSAGIA
jgi:arabinose-5-phosphate isomerase